MLWNRYRAVIFDLDGTLIDNSASFRLAYETACQLAPGNMEYIQALERLSGSAQGYRPEGYEVFTTGCGDNMCGRLACAYCLCNALSCGGVRFFWC